MQTVEAENFWRADVLPNVMEAYRGSIGRDDRLALGNALLPFAPWTSVFELGCHCGPVRDALRLRFGPEWLYVGMDINWTALEEARRRALSVHDREAKFIHGNARLSLDAIADDAYDLVVTSSTLAHIAPEHIEAVFRNLIRIARRAMVIQEVSVARPLGIPEWAHDYVALAQCCGFVAEVIASGIVVCRKALYLETPAKPASASLRAHRDDSPLRGNFDPPLRRNKIAIVGFGPTTRDQAPFTDPSFEIWGQNQFAFRQARCDRIFELHPRANIEAEDQVGVAGAGKDARDSSGYLALLQQEAKRPIYMVQAQPDIPASVEFPHATLSAYFGAHCPKIAKAPYVTSTFGHMLQLAIYKLLTEQQSDPEIHVYGVDLLSDEEYAYQRSNAEALCMYAMGAGITLHIPDQSAIFSNAGVYGYSLGEAADTVSRMQTHLLSRRQLLLKDQAMFSQQAQHANRGVAASTSQLAELDKILVWLETIMRGGAIERPWEAQ